jgi:hypothetical protein
MFRINQPASWLPGALLAAFAALLVVAGARRRSPGILAAAAALFAAALVLKIVIARYAGPHSVMSLELVVS